jgi:lipid A 3-O-deacylase
MASNMPKFLRFNALPLGLVMVVCGLMGVPSAQARDGFSMELGHGNHTEMVAVSLTREWSQPIYEFESLSIGGYWDLGASFWNPHSNDGGNHQVADIAFTPVFRLTQKVRSHFAPFAEAAVGASVMSTHNVWRGHNMSSNFQFADHVAAGVSFGQKLEWDVAARLQHFSNGGIRNPNPGINFFELRLDYHF